PMLSDEAQNYLVTGQRPGRLGNAHPSIVPYRSFATRDGHIVVAVGNDAQFARMCDSIGQPALATDPRFTTNAARVSNRIALIAILGPIFAARERRHWIDAIEAATVPGGPMNDNAQ